MANSKIEWTDKVWNPITGCTPISRGCDNCYAKKFATRLRGRCGYDSENPFKITYHPNRLLEPLTWKKPQKVFVGSMGDIFHNDVDWSFIDKMFAIMALCPQHTFMILTKRAENMKKYFNADKGNMILRLENATYEIGLCDKKDDDIDAASCYIFNRAEKEYPFKNIWTGVSIEDSNAATSRIYNLTQTKSALRFISCEPLLSSIDLKLVQNCDHCFKHGKQYHFTHPCEKCGAIAGKLPINWIIAGGENGQNARPCHSLWIKTLKDISVNNGIPFFFKGYGSWTDNIPENIKLPSSSWAHVCPSTSHVSYGTNQSMDYTHHYDLYAKVGKSKTGNLIDGKMYQEFPQI